MRDGDSTELWTAYVIYNAYTAYTAITDYGAIMPIHITWLNILGLGEKSRMGGLNSEYPLNYYDYYNTCGAKIVRNMLW